MLLTVSSRCSTCAGTGDYPAGTASPGVCPDCTAGLTPIATIDFSDVIDKIDNIEDKVDDILEKLNE